MSLPCVCTHASSEHLDPENGRVSWCRHVDVRNVGDGLLESNRCRCAGYEADLDELEEEGPDDD